MGHLRLELWALPRDGEPYPLPDLEKWQVGPRDDEPGLLEIRYPTATGRYADRLLPIVDDDIDLDVEARLVDGEGGEWRDVFIVDEADLDDVEETGLATFRGLQQSRLFDEVVIPYHPAPAGQEDETSGQGETPAVGSAGRIARELLEAAQSRGCLVGVHWSFTDSHDSNGQAWDREGVLRFSPGQTYRAMLGTLRGYQLADWQLTADRELRLVNVDIVDGYGIGTDLTTGPNPVTLERGRDLGDAPRKWRIRDAVTALFSSGKDGLYTSASDTSAQARRGRRVEGYHSFGNTADPGTLAALTQRRLGTQTRGRVEVSHKIILGEGPTPLIDYLPGDRLYSATRRGVDKRRVRQITVDGDADQAVSVAVTAGDLLDDAAVRQQQQLDAIASGEVGVGTSTPPPDIDDGSIPDSPDGLVVSSLWYATNEGVGATSATAVWTPVPDSRVQGYAVEWSYPGMGWSSLGEVAATTVAWSGLRPGETMYTRVAAVNKWGRRSEWSPTYTTVLEADGTPPPTLSAPAPYPYIGMVAVPWDGMGASGEPMPGDFLRGELHRSTTSGFTPHRPLDADGRLDEAASTTYRGELRAGMTVPDQVPADWYRIEPNGTDPGRAGTTVYYRLVGVDRTGNAATVSAQGSVVPLPVQDDEIAELGVGKLRAGTINALVAIGEKLYAGNPNGAGWEGDPAGFRFYGMIGGVRTALLEFVAATATLVLRGQFEARGSGQARIGIFPEALPIIRLWSPNGAHGPAFLNAYDDSDSPGRTGLGINAGRTGSGAQFRYSRVIMFPDQARMEVVQEGQAHAGGYFGAFSGDADVPLNFGVTGRGITTPGWGQINRSGTLSYYINNVREFEVNSNGAIARRFRGWGGPAMIAAANGADISFGYQDNNGVLSAAVFTGTGNFWLKSFVIPHPLDDPDRPERWLVHGCTESPTAGVEYTGEQLVDEVAIVALPDYFEALVDDHGRTVQLTLVDDGGPLARVAAGPVRDGRFSIRTDADRPVRVAWHARGHRRDTAFEVEPRREDYHAVGDGPYRYLIPKEGDAA